MTIRAIAPTGQVVRHAERALRTIDALVAQKPSRRAAGRLVASTRLAARSPTGLASGRALLELAGVAIVLSFFMAAAILA